MENIDPSQNIELMMHMKMIINRMSTMQASTHHRYRSRWALSSTLAILLSAWAAPGVAQSDEELVLYGVIDTGISATRISGQNSRIGAMSGGLTDSLWGLRGAHDLGNGAQAIFNLESGFDANTGSLDDSARLFNYSAWVGLTDQQLGELRMGRQHTVGQQFGSELEISSWKDFGLGATFKASDNFQLSNTVSYLSPSFAGLQFGLGYSFNADDGQRYSTNGNARAFSTGLRYEDGPLYIALTYDKLRPGHDDARQVNSPQTWQLGASYDFDVVKLAAGWSRQKDGFTGLNGSGFSNPALTDPERLDGLGPAEFAQGGHVNSWFLGAALPVGSNGHLLAQWSMANPSWTWEDNGQRAKKVHVYTLGYVHDLSPRTSLYAFAGRMQNATPDDLFSSQNQNTSRLGAGLTHRF